MSDRLISTLLWIVAIWVLVDALIAVLLFWPDWNRNADIGERDDGDT